MREMILRQGRVVRGFEDFGLGAAVTPPPQLPQLAALTAGNPAFASSWNQIQNQLVSEGADATQFQSAQQALVNSWTQLSSSQFGAADQALATATQYVMTAQTALGAITTVKGLVNAVQSGKPPPPAVVQAFTGTMIGVLEGVGALSAGVGAAIVSGVALGLSVLESVAPLLFGAPPSGTQVCPGVFVNPTPAVVVGCMSVWGPDGTAGTFIPIDPSSTAWRSFPDASNPIDAWWYQTHNGGPSTSWMGAEFATTWGIGRQVDFAFPVYHWIECDVQNAPAELMSFYQAFFEAWKANAAYALNGLQPQPDTSVLAHTCLLWNRANPSGTPYTITPVQVLGGETPNVGVPCSSPQLGMTYAQTLVQSIIDNPVNGLGVNGSVVINLPTMITNPVPPIVPVTPPASTTKSTAATVALGTAAVAAVGAGSLYAYATLNGLTMAEALRRLF